MKKPRKKYHSHRSHTMAINPDTMLADLLALADDHYARRCVFAQGVAKTKRKQQKVKQRVATAAALVRLRKTWRAWTLAQGVRDKLGRFRLPVGGRIIDRVVSVMQPGCWYGRGDLIALAGLYRNARGIINQVLLPRGFVVRARNPKWEGCDDGMRMRKASDALEPFWLYRLTAKGEALRALVLAVAG